MASNSNAKQKKSKLPLIVLIGCLIIIAGWFAVDKLVLNKRAAPPDTSVASSQTKSSGQLIRKKIVAATATPTPIELPDRPALQPSPLIQSPLVAKDETAAGKTAAVDGPAKGPSPDDASSAADPKTAAGDAKKMDTTQPVSVLTSDERQLPVDDRTAQATDPAVVTTPAESTAKTTPAASPTKTSPDPAAVPTVTETQSAVVTGRDLSTTTATPPAPSTGTLPADETRPPKLKKGTKRMYGNNAGKVSVKADGSSEPSATLKKRHPLSIYSLRLSSNRSKESAEDSLMQYRRRGLSPYIAKFDLGPERGVWWNVYVGHYRSLEDARRARKHKKLSSAIVKQLPYANLIATAATEDELTATYQRLQTKGYDPYLIQDSGGVWRLYAGDFHTIEGAAQRHREELTRDGFDSQTVTR